MEGPFEESFGYFAPLESENWMDRSNGKSETPILVGKFDWDPVPLRFDMELDMDTEFFKSECCEPSKEVELTLAELNDERPMSPLINPEMERLHRIATRAERDLASPCAAFTVPRKAMPYITLELSEQSIKKEDFAPCSGREVKSEGVANGGDSEGSSQRSDNNNPPVTWAVIQPPAENGQITHENYGATQPIKIEVEARSQPCGRSASLAQEVGDEFHGATKELEDKGFVVAVKKEKDQELNREPVSADEQEESADEDSDDDFEVDGLSPGSKNRKGRRGDSDDLSPNPQKLLEISKELERLNKVISDLKPIHQLPVNARTRSRKEKNKLASRYCPCTLPHVYAVSFGCTTSALERVSAFSPCCLLMHVFHWY